MLEKSSQLRKHLQGNPLALHLAPFATSLKENGYTGGTLQWKLVSLAGFGRWLRKTGRGVAHLDERCVDAFDFRRSFLSSAILLYPSLASAKSKPAYDSGISRLLPPPSAFCETKAWQNAL